ncbi:MAG: peptide-binding protein [Phycisphaerales bacterium]|nr:MAG: peptide-binding protein [Phycisphaerales bacterium]
MQNNFGLKDLIVLVLLLGLLASVWIAIYQDDRRWVQTQKATLRLEELEKQLVRLEQKIQARPQVVAVPQGGAVAPGQSPTQETSAQPDWARPGVEVTVSEPWTFSSDPYADEGFSMGGEFVEIYEGQPPKVTPYTYADVYGRRVNDLVCESLGWYDPRTLQMRGRLAEAWQYDPAGMWLRVKIRDEACFSDGRPVLAEDVRWTYEDLLFNQEIEAERFRSVYSAIEDVRVVGDPATSKVVEFDFKSPRFDNLDQALGFKVLPKHVYEPWIESPTMFNQSTGLTVGSGPFRFATVSPESQWSPPEDIVLVRNEQYWGPRPPLDRYRIKIIGDQVTRLVAYTNGQGDMMRPNAQQFIEQRNDQRFLEKHDARIWYNMRGGYSFIAWQCGPRNGQRLTPFADKRVRQAMTYLIDREKIRRDISKNLVRPATGPFLSSTPQANPDIKPYPYDPQRGLALLAEAGWRDRDNDGKLEDEQGNPFTFEFTFSSGSESTLQMANAMKADLARYGIDMQLRTIDWSVLADILNRRDFDAITFAWSASSPESDPYQIWHSDNIENQGDNFIQWSNPKADELIERGRQTMDFDERMKVWHQLHEVFHEEQPYTFMSEIPWLRFTTKRAGNIQEYPSGLEYWEFFVRRESLPARP